MYEKCLITLLWTTSKTLAMVMKNGKILVDEGSDSSPCPVIYSKLEGGSISFLGVSQSQTTMVNSVKIGRRMSILSAQAPKIGQYPDDCCFP